MSTYSTENPENDAHCESHISESKKAGQVFRYNGEDYLPCLPIHNEIVAENDDSKLTENIKRVLTNKKDIPFMPVDIEEYNEYINNTPHYVLRIYGCLVNGEKAVVTISGIKVFFDIRVPENKDIDSLKTEIKNILSNGKDDEGKTSYLRIITTNTFQRKIALEISRKENLETASDDRSAYYRKVEREYRIPLSGWALMSNYEYNNSRLSYNAQSPLCTHASYAPINDFRPIDDPSTLHKTYPSSLITHDRTLVLAWDIETNSTRGLDSLPMARYKEDNVFIICMTVNWKDDPKPLKQIRLVDKLLKAFALCWRALAPDIEITYNGFKYDWPFIIERATQQKLLDWMFLRMSGNPHQKNTIDGILHKDNEKIKNREGIEIKIPPDGKFISTFLKGLDVFQLIKIDMPIKDMRIYYEKSKKITTTETIKNIHKIAKYCIVDSISCQKLMIRRNAVNDYREVASIAYVSLFDLHYYAGGMKVCNLLGAKAWKRDILITMIFSKQTESGKFPGAYVFPPEKGLENKRPVTGLDFASLYPSIIMNYNLSPDKMISKSEEADTLKKEKESLHEIEFLFNDRILRAWSN
nr:4718_t:CDS:2 [Entrophospora candida]